MKILAIIGARKSGNTSEIVKYFEGRCRERSRGMGEVSFDYLYLSDYDIGFCTGCHNCIFVGEDKCPHHGTIKQIEDRILDSDVLVLASPGYMYSVTGIMKSFLDHVAYNCHRPKYFGKRAFLIGCCTKWLEKGVMLPMETWASAAGFRVVGKTCVDMLPFPLSESELDKRRKKIDDAASRLMNEMRQDMPQCKPSDAEGDAARQLSFGETFMFYVFRTLARVAPQILQADFRYFSERKAYDKETAWYVPARVSPVHRWMARFAERRMHSALLKMTDQDKLKDASPSFRNKL